MSLTLEKPKRIIDTKYTRWVKTQPCFAIAAAGMLGDYERSCEGPMDHHHAKEQGHAILGSKVSDRRSIPTCRRHHRMAEANPNYFRGFFATLIRDLNVQYDATHKPKPVTERKVSPTVQHLLIACECRKVHKLPTSKVSRDGPIPTLAVRFWCPILKEYRNAFFRRGA